MATKIRPVPRTAEPEELARPARAKSGQEERTEAAIVKALARREEPMLRLATLSIKKSSVLELMEMDPEPTESKTWQAGKVLTPTTIEDLNNDVVRLIQSKLELVDHVALKRASSSLHMLTQGDDAMWEQHHRRTFGGDKPTSCQTYEEAYNRLKMNFSKGAGIKRDPYRLLDCESFWYNISEGKLLQIVDFEHPIIEIIDIETHKTLGHVSLSPGSPSFYLKHGISFKNGNLYAVCYKDQNLRIQAWNNNLQPSHDFEFQTEKEMGKFIGLYVRDDKIIVLAFDNGAILYSLSTRSHETSLNPVNFSGRVFFNDKEIRYYLTDPRLRLQGIKECISTFDKTGKLEREILFSDDIHRFGKIERLAVSEKFYAVVLRKPRAFIGQRVNAETTILVYDIEKQKWLESPVLVRSKELYQLNFIQILDQFLCIEVNLNGHRSFMVFDLEKFSANPEGTTSAFLNYMGKDLEIQGRKFDQGKYYYRSGQQIFAFDFTQPQRGE